MKAVILAGGLGTRISEETYLKPKPMVEVGGKPILWHIMKRVMAGSVMVMGWPAKTWSTNSGITEPREAITLP